MQRRNAVKVLVLVALISAIVPPAIFGEARVIDGQVGGDDWRNFIYDFQTLIGGLFAVFAAWWTVDTMERTDQAAQERHDQLMTQQTRPDALKVERYMKTEFHNVVDALRVLTENRLPQGVSAEEILGDYRDRARVIEGCVNCTRNFDIQANWKACAPLFGGALERDWQEFSEVARSIGLASSTISHYVAPTYDDLHNSKDRDKFVKHDAEAKLIIESLPVQLDSAVEKLGFVVGHFRKLGRLYGVDETI